MKDVFPEISEYGTIRKEVEKCFLFFFAEPAYFRDIGVDVVLMFALEVMPCDCSYKHCEIAPR